MDQYSQPQGEPAGGKASDVTAAALLLPAMAVGLTMYYLWDTVDVTWEARATGVLVGAVLLTLVAIQVGITVVAALKGRVTWGVSDLFDNSAVDWKRWSLLGVSALFVATIQWVGTALGLILVLVASLLITGVRNVTQIVLISVITSGAVYGLLMYLLGSRLPRGPLDTLLDRLLGL